MTVYRFATWLLLVSAMGRVASASEGTELERIKSIWSTRESNCLNGVIIDTEMEFVQIKGGMNRLLQAINDPTVTEWPPQDAVVKGRRKVIMRGSNLRIEDLSGFDSRASAGADNQLHAATGLRTETFNGSETRAMVIDDVRSRPTTGSIRLGNETTSGNEIVMRPLFLVLCPSYKSVSQLDIEKMRILDSELLISNEKATVVEFPIGQSPLRYRLALASGKDFVPIRIELLRNDDTTRWFCDIQYEPHRVLGFVPARWTYSLFDPKGGGLMASASARLISLRLDAEIPSSIFTLNFPNGTIVEDERRNDPDFVLIADGNGGFKRVARDAIQDNTGTPGTLVSSLVLKVAVVLASLAMVALLFLLKGKRAL